MIVRIIIIKGDLYFFDSVSREFLTGSRPDLT